ncbi:MAG: dynamin family protein [Pseudonocardiaceae bacterium]
MRSDAVGPLAAAVAQLCRTVAPRLGGRSAAAVGTVADRLGSPLQVAVVGRVSSGKSTLVNALIGRRVAPTGVGECTRLVTRFRSGTADRVDVVLRDGGRRSLPLDADGAVPADLGVDPTAVAHLDVRLTSALLRDLTVVDTPGLGSVDGAVTPDATGTGGAEAVLYVITQAARADDAQALATFATGCAGPGNVVAVLTKADTVPGGWAAARALAQRQAAALRPRVADVLPVVGLLAETAESGAFTSGDAAALHDLAAADDQTRTTLLASTDLFTDLDAPVPAAVRRRLLASLDLYGVAHALALIDADPALTAGGLRRGLLAASGFEVVRARIDAVFRNRADGLKAAAALASLATLPRDPRERDVLRSAVEGLLQRPAAHQLRLLHALTQVTSGAVALPDHLVDEVLRVGGSSAAAAQLGAVGSSPAELTATALDRAGWWRSFASFGATPAQARVAHEVHRAYFLLWQQLRGR